MSRADRAKQFMPFSPLRGYGDELKEKEKIISPKKELTDEQSKVLSETVRDLKKGDIVKVVYYSGDGYVEKTGAVSLIDTAIGNIRIVKTIIPFSDVYSITQER